MAQCPACERSNASEDRYCRSCGTPLVMRCAACDTINARTREACHHCHAPLRFESTAVPEVPLPVIPVLTEDGEDPVPEDWRLALRDDALIEGSMAPAAHSAPPRPPPLLVGDPDAPRHPPVQAKAEFAEAKARRRAAVRRSQQLRQPLPPPPAARDVLVLEPDPASRTQVCAVLEAFGFRPHVAVSVAEAEGLSLRRHHVVAFLGLGDDALPAAELCGRLRNFARMRPSALIAIGERDRHSDRVRMQLAGADMVLFRPVSRGDLARALEACGLSLPQDPRLGAASGAPTGP
jgi:CheY-like chemotaxis protein